MLDRIVAWAQSSGDVQAVLLLGSHARVDVPADEWSDIDLGVLVDEPARYLDSSDWLDEFGPVLLTVVEPSAVGGGWERRVLFESGIDVDFNVVPAELAAALDDVIDDPHVRAVLGRGVRVLVDKLGRASMLERVSAGPSVPAESISVTAYRTLSHAFWFSLLGAAKKLRRGEVWVAKTSCDGALQERIVELLAWNVRLQDPAADTWHRGRFLERWAGDTELRELRAASAMYDADDVARALRCSADLFERLETDCARRAGYPIAVAHAAVRAQLDRVLPVR